MRYRGFEIVTRFEKHLKNYCNEAMEAEYCPGYECEVYLAEDKDRVRILTAFHLVEGYEITDCSQTSMEEGVIRYVDRAWLVLSQAGERMKNERKNCLLGRLIHWTGESEEELYEMLHDQIGMTDAEIRESTGLSLVPYFHPKEYACLIADELIDDGSEHSTSGNWITGYKEIKERYGVDLYSHEKMRGLVSARLYERSDAVADFCLTEDSIHLDFYYGRCPYYCGEEEEMDEAEVQQI